MVSVSIHLWAYLRKLNNTVIASNTRCNLLILLYAVARYKSDNILEKLLQQVSNFHLNGQVHCGDYDITVSNSYTMAARDLSCEARGLCLRDESDKSHTSRRQHGMTIL